MSRSQKGSPPRVVSINVSQVRELEHRGRRIRTGIDKRPIEGAVRVTTRGLEGDERADTRAHGGLDSAIYAYSLEYYSHWRRALGRNDLQLGLFGENLTVMGLTDDVVHIGDVLRIGSTRLQVTQARMPCYKLAIRIGSSDFPKTFLESGRLGYYMRVLEEGEIRPADAIERLETGSPPMSVERIGRLMRAEDRKTTEILHALSIRGLSENWRRSLTRALGGVAASRPGPAT